MSILCDKQPVQHCADWQDTGHSEAERMAVPETYRLAVGGRAVNPLSYLTPAVNTNG